MTSIRVTRWIMVALSAAIALFLIARGNVVIGVLLGALAVMRASLLIRLGNRREQFRQRAASNRPGPRWQSRRDTH